MKKHTVFKLNAIFWGVALLAIGVGAILVSSGIIPGNIYLVLMTALFAAIFIRSLIGFHFVPLLISAAHLLHLYRGCDIGIPEKLPSWMMIVASVVIGVGLELIFGGLKKRIKLAIKEKNAYQDGNYQGNPNVKTIYGDGHGNGAGTYTDSVVGNNFHIENGFGEQTRYIRGTEFCNGHIENGFGGLTVYFEDVKMLNDQANLSIENGFGHINIYLPSSWSVAMTEENGMGQIVRHGNPSTEPTAPRLNLHVENGMGKVEIYFN
ncbi:MAG: cell wall-active antibiotics response protein [Lachnospiraceae bacterium]|nr:cell wall-active antibiotics response protein [Lachnospiraceae bacterium]